MSVAQSQGKSVESVLSCCYAQVKNSTKLVDQHNHHIFTSQFYLRNTPKSCSYCIKKGENNNCAASKRIFMEFQDLNVDLKKMKAQI
jgi:hypothetical protein